MPLQEGQMVRRQQILADFGEFALRSDKLDEVLTEACRLVGEAIGTQRAKILEIQEEGRSLLVRAGVGWPSGVVGRVRLPMEEYSSESFSIEAGKPVISQNIHEETRFKIPDFMKEAGVVALVNVPIFLPGGRAYGLLQVDSDKPRDYAQEDTEFLRTYATILGPVIDRLHKTLDLRATRERFRLIVENARDYAVLVTDTEARIIDWLPGAEAVFGWTAEEIRGRPCEVLFTAEDREAGVVAAELATARTSGTAPNRRWQLRKDGSQVFIEGSVTALHNEPGSVSGFLKIGQDITERLRAEERLKAEKERFRTLLEGIPQLVWRSFDEGHWSWAGPQWLNYTGQSQEETHGLGWLQVVHPDDREATMQAWHETRTRGGLDVEHRLRRASDGSYRWHRTRSVPRRDDAGTSLAEAHILEWLGTSTEIDDLKVLQGQQGILVAELQHRTRNLLGVVRSMARRSFGPSPGRQQYDARLSALGRVQGFLSRSPDWEVSLLDLLDAELIAAGDGTSDRVVVQGPPLQLPGEKVQPLALALHELATNAVKYGAIGQPGGHLKVTWRMDGRGATRALVLDWRESGVAMPAGPPERRGYGSELIERALPYQLKAQTRLEFGPDGVHCTITLPLGHSEAEGSEA